MNLSIYFKGRIKGFGTYSEMSNSGIDLGQFLENKEAEEEDSEIETEDMNMFSDDTYSSVGKHSLRYVPFIMFSFLMSSTLIKFCH